MPETLTDRLVTLAQLNGWAIDDRRQIGLVWFSRGPVEWAHLGTDAEGERVLSACGGIKGRPTRYWVSGRTTQLGAAHTDRAAVLAERLAAEPYRFTD